MRALPPRVQRQGKPEDVRRYLGRIHDARHRRFDMTLWVVPEGKTWVGPDDNPEKLWSTVSRQKCVTTEGAITAGCPVEMWTWCDKAGERVHIRSIERKPRATKKDKPT